MPSIVEYSGLIKSIPVYNQSAKINKKVWNELLCNEEDIKIELLGGENDFELSREEVLSEDDKEKRIVMALMWGYPTGGRGKNIKDTLTEIDKLKQLLSEAQDLDLTKEQADNLIEQIDSIHGLGMSTWSKLLYFFNVSIESRRCQIYDLKIVDSLNRQQFCELETQEWKHSRNHYYQYIELVDDLAMRMCVSPEQVELFLFYFNHDYKF